MKRTYLDEQQDFYYDEFKIRKKNKKKFRKIVAPSPALKHYQRAARHKLAWFFAKEAERHNIYQYFHGFIKGKNAVTGAYSHIGFTTTLMMDLSNHFDNIKQFMFDEYMFEQLDLNPAYLFHKSGKYAAQGFPSSPMLANIALIPFVVAIVSYLNDTIGSDNWALTIFADDITISYNNQDKYDTIWKDIRKHITNLAEQFGFEINKSKTRVRFAKYGWRRILGINVGDKSIRATRKTIKKIYRLQKKLKNGEIPKDEYNSEIARLGGLSTWSKCYIRKGVALCDSYYKWFKSKQKQED
jgi:hypothetical protein